LKLNFAKGKPHTLCLLTLNDVDLITDTIVSALNEKQPTTTYDVYQKPKKIEPLNKIDDLPKKHWQPIMQLANKINELVKAYNRSLE
jgi:hypothetical protein